MVEQSGPPMDGAVDQDEQESTETAESTAAATEDESVDAGSTVESTSEDDAPSNDNTGASTDSSSALDGVEVFVYESDDETAEASDSSDDSDTADSTDMNPEDDGSSDSSGSDDISSDEVVIEIVADDSSGNTTIEDGSDEGGVFVIDESGSDDVIWIEDGSSSSNEESDDEDDLEYPVPDEEWDESEATQEGDEFEGIDAEAGETNSESASGDDEGSGTIPWILEHPDRIQRVEGLPSLSLDDDEDETLEPRDLVEQPVIEEQLPYPFPTGPGVPGSRTFDPAFAAGDSEAGEPSRQLPSMRDSGDGDASDPPSCIDERLVAGDSEAGEPSKSIDVDDSVLERVRTPDLGFANRSGLLAGEDPPPAPPDEALNVKPLDPTYSGDPVADWAGENSDHLEDRLFREDFDGRDPDMVPSPLEEFGAADPRDLPTDRYTPMTVEGPAQDSPAERGGPVNEPDPRIAERIDGAPRIQLDPVEEESGEHLLVEAYPLETASIKPEEQPEEEDPPVGYQNIDTMLTAEDAKAQVDDGSGAPLIDPGILNVSPYAGPQATTEMPSLRAEDDADARYELIANDPVPPDEDGGEEALVGDARGEGINSAAERMLPDFDAGRIAEAPAGRHLDVFDIGTSTSNLPGGDSMTPDIGARDHSSMFDLGSNQSDGVNSGPSVADDGWRLGEWTDHPDGSMSAPIYDKDPVSGSGSDGVIVEKVIGETTWGPSPDNPNVWEGATVVNGETVTVTTQVTQSDGTEVTLHTYTDEQGNSVTRTTTVAPDGSRTETWERTDADGNVTTETKHYDKDGNEVSTPESSNEEAAEGSGSDSGDDGSDDQSGSDDASGDAGGTDAESAGEEAEAETSIDPFGPQPMTPEQFERARVYAEWKAQVQAGSDITPAPEDGEGDGGDADGTGMPGVKDPDEEQILQDLEGVTLVPGVRDQGDIDFGPDHNYGPGPQQSDPSAYADENQQEFQEANAGPQDAILHESIDFTPSFESGQAATEQIEATMSGEDQQEIADRWLAAQGDDDGNGLQTFRSTWQIDDLKAPLREEFDPDDDDDLDDDMD